MKKINYEELKVGEEITVYKIGISAEKKIYVDKNLFKVAVIEHTTNCKGVYENAVLDPVERSQFFPNNVNTSRLNNLEYTSGHTEGFTMYALDDDEDTINSFKRQCKDRLQDDIEHFCNAIRIDQMHLQERTKILTLLDNNCEDINE